MALDEGTNVARASKEVGIPEDTARRWAAGGLPHCHPGGTRASGRIAGSAKPSKRRRPVPEASPLRPAEVRPAGGHEPRPDREPAAQGGVGRPKRGRLAPPFDPDAEQVRARREIEAGDRSADVRDYPFP